MERLTKYLASGAATYDYPVDCYSGVDCYDRVAKSVYRQLCVERLAAYEDTGLEPERCAEFARADAEGRYIVMRDAEQDGVARLRELAVADKDGRLVVLPCKVGDTVYFRTYDCNGTVDLGIQPHKVTAIVWNAIVRGRYIDVGLPSGQYGVSWFLTREEAEKALEATKNE